MWKYYAAEILWPVYSLHIEVWWHNFFIFFTLQDRTYQTRITDLEAQLSQARVEIAKVKREKEEVIIIFFWLSEWLLFNANSTFFQLYHGENKLIFNEMMRRSALY
jgi:hypothetical protein